MKKHVCVPISILVFAFSAVSAFATVTVSSPVNGSTVTTNVAFKASASTSCSKGVASMGIYPAPYQLAYTVNGSSLNTTLPLNAGSYNVVVEEWDYCGGASTATVSITVKTGSGVYVTSPTNGSTVGSPAHFVATSTTSCSLGVASMGIYTGTNQLAYTVGGSSLNTSLNLSPGTYYTTVEEWDKCGGAATTPVKITVSGSGKTFYNIQSIGGWRSYAQQPPSYGDCTTCTPSGPGTTWAMYQGIKSPTLSGSSTQFNIGGTQVYTDVLWNNHLIGDLSSEGLPDSSHTLVPQYHTFTYDAYFWGNNLGAAQALEFDVNQFFNGMGFTWGTECRIAGGNEWDIWNSSKWVPTGVPCNPNSNGWNHVTIQVSRTSNNQLFYQSITLNGVTHVLNKTYPPFSAPGWWGITVNYQMDGNSKQTPYTVYVDKLNLTYE
jgi:hypothetical protein